MRLPVRQIQAYVASLHGLRISSGEIIGLGEPHHSPAGAAAGRPQAADSREGWRCRWMKQDGEKMGAMARCGVPVRRSCAITSIIIREAAKWSKRCWANAVFGVLGSDFLASYNIHQGLHQRMPGCISDATETLSKSSIPRTPTCEPWAKDVKALYDRAVAYAGPDLSLPAAKQEAARRKQQHAFEQDLWQLCAPYAHTSSPLHTLCERVERFLPELFVFVARPEVPSDNNLAERSVRPLVIARKISGGSRSPRGSDTRMDLFSLFGMWAAQGLNPFFQCLAELSQPHSLR